MWPAPTPTVTEPAASRPHPSLRARLAAAAVRLTSGLARRLGRGGSVIGAQVGLRIDPGLVGHLAADRWIAAVSATNGKTTTNRLLAEALRHLGPVATNAEGSNLQSGLATTLSLDPQSTIAALEVDEATLAVLAGVLQPAVFVLANLSRDQLDRYGEVRIIAERWREMLAALHATKTPPIAMLGGDPAAPERVRPDAVVAARAGHVIANADDPLVVWASQPAPRHTWVAAGMGWTNDTAVCPACRAAIERDGSAWRCSACDLARPTPDYTVSGTTLLAPDGNRHEVRLALPGDFNIANAAMAAVAAVHAGVPLDVALAAMADTTEVAGRYRTVEVDGRQVRLLMAKNPAGWQQSLALLGDVATPVVVGINARVADGHDPSWLWDVPFEELAGRTVVATGDRARDLSVRLHYAGVPHTVRPGPALAAIGTLAAGGPVDLVANYTVFADVLAAVGP